MNTYQNRPVAYAFAYHRPFKYYKPDGAVLLLLCLLFRRVLTGETFVWGEVDCHTGNFSDINSQAVQCLAFSSLAGICSSAPWLKGLLAFA